MRTPRRVRAALISGAIVAVGLLLNVFVLAPAFHQRGELHNPRTCTICTLQATGCIAPPITAELPHPAPTALRAPVARPAHFRSEDGSTIFVRGPPRVRTHRT